MRPAIWIPVATLLLVAGTIGSWTAVVQDRDITRETMALNEQVGRLLRDLQAAIVSRELQAAIVSRETKALNEQVGRLLRANETTVPGDYPLSDIEAFKLMTADDAEAARRELGNVPNAFQIASCLSELDSWVIFPGDEHKVISIQQELVSRLRDQAKKEVREIQDRCLLAPNGNEAIRLHGEAGQVLALYPMSDDKSVLDEAKALSAQQVDIFNRIEVLRRQRYNQWASKQIETAIDGYNKGSSYWSPKNENKVLIDSLVQSIGELDPVLIEPVVMELYNYVIDLTKASISEKEKVELAKRLTDPSIRRKTLGDF